jgi:ferric-dicitrate binding protein FerR (iron transport regulator)
MNYENFSEEEFILDESFQDWVRGIDPDNNAAWELWLAQHPEKFDVVQNARRVLMDLFVQEKPLPQSTINAAWKEVNEVLEQREQVEIEQSFGSRPLWGNWRQWAAVVAGIFILSSSYWLYATRKTSFSTQYGQTASLTLPDGSRVVLNGNSRLRYAANWDNQRTREVWLEGEGFFTITKKPGLDALHKDYAHFVVHTTELDVQVLGTSFNVSERKAKTQVVLSSGKVKLDINTRPNSSPLLMVPGESVEFIHRDEQVIRKKVDPAAFSSWQNSELVFKDTPLFEVADIIESTYGMAMVFQNVSQRNRRLTGNIRTDNIDKILKALSRSLNLEFVQVNKQIMVRELPSDSENN